MVKSGMSRFSKGEMVAFRCGGHDLIGRVEIIDYRGWERSAFEDCEWSYDIIVENSPDFDGKPCLYKHVPECRVRALPNR